MTSINSQICDWINFFRCILRALKSLELRDHIKDIDTMAEGKFKVGDRVKWDSSGGQAEGKVVRVARTSGSIKGFKYKASTDNPRYIVETDDGKHAAHKAKELHRA